MKKNEVTTEVARVGRFFYLSKGQDLPNRGVEKSDQVENVPVILDKGEVTLVVTHDVSCDHLISLHDCFTKKNEVPSVSSGEGVGFSTASG